MRVALEYSINLFSISETNTISVGSCEVDIDPSRYQTTLKEYPNDRILDLLKDALGGRGNTDRFTLSGKIVFPLDPTTQTAKIQMTVLPKTEMTEAEITTIFPNKENK